MVRGSEDAISLSCVTCFLQVENYSKKLLAKKKEVVKGGSMVSEHTLGIGKKDAALQDPQNMTVYHALHCLA